MAGISGGVEWRVAIRRPGWKVECGKAGTADERLKAVCYK